MYYSKIIIQNFRGISNIELSFKPGINIIVGDNGAGKTSVMEALAVSLGGYIDGIKGVSARGIQQNDIRYTISGEGNIQKRVEYCVPVRIESTASIEEKSYSWEVIRESELGTDGTKRRNTSNNIVDYARCVANSESGIQPLIEYIGAKRVFEKITNNGNTGIFSDRRNGYLKCNEGVIDIGFIVNWFKTMDMESYRLKKEIFAYELVKKTISMFMKDMEETSDVSTISYSSALGTEGEIVFKSSKDNDGEISITSLSAGYQSLLWILMDICCRSIVLNPGIKDFADIEGVVFIDEIDLHLHPKWQWNIVNVIHKYMPKLQLIIATHSPIIISSCKDANIISLEDTREVTYLGDGYAQSIGDIVELKLGSSRIPGALSTMIYEFEDYYNTQQIEKAKGILNTMIEKYGVDNSEVKMAQMKISILED